MLMMFPLDTIVCSIVHEPRRVCTLALYLVCCKRLVALHSFCALACATIGHWRCRVAAALLGLRALTIGLAV